MATASSLEKDDNWTSEAYSKAGSFVPKLTSTVISYLAPQPTDNILDIGCGDGILSAQIAEKCSTVLALDSSPHMIEAAKAAYGSQTNLSFRIADCRQLSRALNDDKRQWDKIFSNAALHWILRDPSTRKRVFHDVYDALRPGGMFVFEMGGAGNVAEVHAALIQALVHEGCTVDEARESGPWYFPSAQWMRSTLKETGFEVETVETEYRPTRLTKEGGLEAWVRLMGAEFLKRVKTERRESVVKQVVDAVDAVIQRDEEGSWLGYVRLRAVAKKR